MFTLNSPFGPLTLPDLFLPRSPVLPLHFFLFFSPPSLTQAVTAAVCSPWQRPCPIQKTVAHGTPSHPLTPAGLEACSMGGNTFLTPQHWPKAAYVGEALG